MIAIDLSLPEPPYEQIRQQFADQIRSGRLVVGTRLPTVRQLAADLGLAVNTVARAYRELEEAGLVETRGRAGTVVASTGDAVRAQAAAAATEYAAAIARLGIPASEALRLVRAALDTAKGRHP